MAKKVKPAVEPTEIEKHKAYIAQQVADINKELQLIQNADGDTTATIGSAISAIGDCLENVESTVTTLCDEADEYRLKVDVLGKEAEELEERVENIIRETDCVQFFSSMVGEVRYKTDNLLDAQVMEKFAEIMQTVQPATLLQHMETLKLL